MLEDLSLKDNLIIKTTLEEALDVIEELHHDLGVNNGVAILILDFEGSSKAKFSVRDAVEFIRNEIINKRIPYTPKIVNLSSNSSK